MLGYAKPKRSAKQRVLVDSGYLNNYSGVTYNKSNDAVTMSANNGYIMMRSGSIIGASLRQEESGLPTLSSSSPTVRVNKNGTDVFTATGPASGSGVMKFSGTQSEGTDTFSAGDVINIRSQKGWISMTNREVIGLAELILDAD